MRIACLAALVLLVGCVDLSKICPYKEITQGVFGEITDANNALEENVEVDLYTTVNGAQGTQVGTPHETGRGGYQFMVSPSTYMLCAKGVCGTVAVPTGLVEFSAVDAASGLTWDAPVAVPPAQSVGPCMYGD